MEMGAWISPVLTAALLSCATVGPALAGDYDGSKPLICAALQATRYVCSTLRATVGVEMSVALE